MVTMLATLFGIGISLYVTVVVCRRALHIVLRWPALVLLGLLMLAAFTGAFGERLFPGSAVARYLSMYPTLFFVFGCIVAYGLGVLGRKRPDCLYRRIPASDTTIPTKPDRLVKQEPAQGLDSNRQAWQGREGEDRS